MTLTSVEEQGRAVEEQRQPQGQRKRDFGYNDRQYNTQTPQRLDVAVSPLQHCSLQRTFLADMRLLFSLAVLHLLRHRVCDTSHICSQNAIFCVTWRFCGSVLVLGIAPPPGDLSGDVVV